MGGVKGEEVGGKGEDGEGGGKGGEVYKIT